MSARLRTRSGGGEHDSDLYGLLTLDARDAQRDPWSVHVLAGAALDVDGRTSPSSPFFSLQDTRDDPFTSVLYEGYVESRAVDGLARIRLGRQMDYALPAIITYDGIDVESQEVGSSRIAVGGYGGVLSRIYTAAENGNSVFGAFVAAAPWKGASARFDWMHLEDATLLGEHQNDLQQLTVGQVLDPSWRFDGTWSRLESATRDASLRATYTDPRGDLLVQAYWYRSFQTLNDLPLEIDPFTPVLLEQSPYTEFRFTASKSFGHSVHLEAGADVRRVSTSEDVAEFNRDFERWHATTTLEDLLPAQIALSVTGEIWNSDSNDTSSFGADLSRRLGEKSTISAGTYYSLYKYDLFLVTEHDDVRTYYLRMRWKGGPAWTWDARYEHEVSFHDYDTLRLGVTWDF